MGKVAVLSPEVQGQIAAGEVVERPASVVKELVENALDAGARQVDVRLAAGGLDRIVVRDDGEGMAPDDAVTAFARHATSKLRVAEDLTAVATLGFRGEALPSIAAVARVRLATRRAADPNGVAVEGDGSGVRPAGMVGVAPGTTVEVHDLFATTPARRKFLRTAATEVGHVVDAIARIAVAVPAVGFRVEHDGREVLALPAVRDRRQRLVQVLGRERAASLVAIEAHAGGWTLDGFVAPPRDTVATARLVWTYVAIGAGSARWIRDRVLLRAVLDGYESLLLRGRYPIGVLFLGVPAGDVDVNVHPAKLEVRFRRPAALHQLVVPAIRARLRDALAPITRPPAGAVHEPVAPYTPASAPATIDGVQAGLWAPAPRGFASLRPIGQIFDGYLVCEGDGRVVLIDQHAAHERVVFERLRAERRAGGVASDALLVPETVSLAAAEVAALAEHRDVLASAGLEGEPFGDGTFLVRTVPRLLRGRDVGSLLRAIAAELVEEGVSAAAERAADAALATVACHAVVRVGQRLDPAEMQALLAAMDGVEISAHCPHGRPVAAELGRTQLEALFKR
ncbi:MAG TPA: DNA mismatch repair endonuclease MutL [Candidatus Binatia bacterium]|nr:DNA mismatch repair endonuclease MutL [Candidatus Binatia bacterium]